MQVIVSGSLQAVEIEETQAIIVPAPQQILTIGERGPQGATGPAGSGDKHYHHVQNSVANSWTIVHNLNKYPSVSIVDSAKTEVEGEVTHNSLNQLTVSFSFAFSGEAYCN